MPRDRGAPLTNTVVFLAAMLSGIVGFSLTAIYRAFTSRECRVCDQRQIQAHKLEEAYRDTILAHLSEIADLRRRCDELTRLQAEALQPGIVERARPREPRPKRPTHDEPQGPEMPPL